MVLDDCWRPAARRRAEVAPRVEPGTAADRPLGTSAPDPRRAIARRAIVAVVVTILRPLKQIYHHVEETELVGWE